MYWKRSGTSGGTSRKPKIFYISSSTTTSTLTTSTMCYKTTDTAATACTRSALTISWGPPLLFFQQIWILMWSKIFISLFCGHPFISKLNNRQTHWQTPAFIYWEIFCFRRKRSAWREKEARDLLRKDVQIHPSAPVMRWHILWHVVFVLILNPRDPDSSFDSSPALSPSKMQSRDLVSSEKNQRDARSVYFMSPFISF